jgi:hypothetical protein
MKISIPNPCKEDWNQMTTSEKGRFCTSCKTQVINFTEMPVEEIKHFLEQETESICGRFSRHQIELFNATYQELPSPSILRKWTMAAVLAGVSALPAFAQGSNFMHLHALSDTSSYYHNNNEVQTTDTSPAKGPIELTGQVIHAEIGEAIVGALIRVKGTKIAVTTDIEGYFRLNIPKSKEMLTLEIKSLGYLTLSHNMVPDSSPIKLVFKLQEEALLGEVILNKKTSKSQ